MQSWASAKLLTVLYGILIGKLKKCELNEQMVRWIENGLYGKLQRVVIGVIGSSWRPVVSPRCKYWI